MSAALGLNQLRFLQFVGGSTWKKISRARSNCSPTVHYREWHLHRLSSLWKKSQVPLFFMTHFRDSVNVLDLLLVNTGAHNREVIILTTLESATAVETPWTRFKKWLPDV